MRAAPGAIEHVRLENERLENQTIAGEPPVGICGSGLLDVVALGMQALVEAEGLEESDLDKVIIAGAFATFIDVKSAITIEMLPNLPVERFTQIENAAGTGARLALISKAERKKADEIARQDNCIELAKIPNFNRKFAKATYL